MMKGFDCKTLYRKKLRTVSGMGSFVFGFVTGTQKFETKIKTITSCKLQLYVQLYVCTPKFGHFGALFHKSNFSQGLSDSLWRYT